MLNKKSFIIETTFGFVESQVSIFPIIYLFTIYFIALFFPQEIWNNKSIYNLWSDTEYLSEHFQFILYFLTTVFTGLNIFFEKKKFFCRQNFFWIIFFVFSLFITIEEISFLNSMEGDFFQDIRNLNLQNEVNFHNSLFFHPLMHGAFIILNIFLGWFGWRFFS